MSGEVRESPCRYCPYRKDVPSGVWAAEEYHKLPDFDAPTPMQPMVPFGCHETGVSGLLCCGWAQCHTNRGNHLDLLALRLIGRPEVPAITTPIFGSGREAAEHGLRDVDQPGFAAMRAAVYLTNLQKKQRAAKKLKTHERNKRIRNSKAQR